MMEEVVLMYKYRMVAPLLIRFGLQVIHSTCWLLNIITLMEAQPQWCLLQMNAKHAELA